jgi:hypothetical protein
MDESVYLKQGQGKAHGGTDAALQYHPKHLRENQGLLDECRLTPILNIGLLDWDEKAKLGKSQYPFGGKD